MSGPELVVSRHECEMTSWMMGRRSPHPRLAAHIVGYEGIWERAPGPMRRCYVPATTVRLFINFGDPLRLLRTPGTRCAPAGPVTSFVAGLCDGVWVSEHPGYEHGVAIYLTPGGARALLGVRMDELANTVVDVGGMLDERAERLAAQLAESPDWTRRMALLDRVLLGWAAAGPGISPPVAWAWRRLDESGGQSRISELADLLGWSRRHLTARFQEEIGLRPKRLARIYRFERAVHLLDAHPRPTLAQVAARCGFSDQAHFTREFRALSSCTVTEFRRAQMADGGGTSAL